MVKTPSTGRPILPASMASFIRRTGSYHRRWLMTPSLTPVLPRRGDHRVAVGEARRQRLLDQDMNAGLGRLDRRLGVQRVRRADEDGLRRRTPRASSATSVKGRAPNRAANASARSAGRVADGDEFRLGQARERRGVDLADLAAADQGGPDGVSSASLREVLRSPFAAGTPATRPSRPCRSCRPRC